MRSSVTSLCLMRDQDLWLFAYGSLIWKPEVDHIEERIGTAHGWHRAFRLRITRWWASADQPGLMMESTVGANVGERCSASLHAVWKRTWANWFGVR